MKNNFIFNGKIYGKITFPNSKSFYYIGLPERYLSEDLKVDLEDAEVIKCIQQSSIHITPQPPFCFELITKKERSRLLKIWEESLEVDTLEEDSYSYLSNKSSHDTSWSMKLTDDITKQMIMRNIMTLL